MSAGRDKASILVVGEADGRADFLAGTLSPSGYSVDLTRDPAGALGLAEQTYFDLIFLSWDGQPARDFLISLGELFPDTMVVALAKDAPLEEVVSAVRLGAFDFLSGDIKAGLVLESAGQALEHRSLIRERGERRLRLRQKYDVANIVGQSGPMQKVFRLIHKVAPTDATALILGESGTGKELVARAIHYQSPRKDKPLVPVNCGAIPGELLESELFGHEKGAFTGAIKTRTGRFELAEGGTVFLDEIGDMSSLLQVKLLRVLQDHQFERVGGSRTIQADIRVIAATNQELEQKVREGSFREDLYYRLNVVPITVPPLRERLSDIPLLCEHFLKRLGEQKGLGKRRLHPQVKDSFLRYGWPGNVRELENLLERMAILADSEEILPEDLPGRIAGEGAAPPELGEAVLTSLEVPEDGLDFNAEVDKFERQLITQALEQTGWVKNRAASLLKLNRTTLVEKIKKKRIAPPGAMGNS